MTDGTQAVSVACVPTWCARFWRKLGFRYHLGDEPIGAYAMPGWMDTTTTFSFSLADRLRMVVTGRLRITTISYTDTPSPMVVKNRVDWKICAPGEHR